MPINWTNVTNPEQYMGLANQATDGLFWLVTNFLVWVVLMIGFLPFGSEIAILTSTFLALVVSLFLAYAGLIAWGWVLFYVGVLLFYMIYIIWSSNKDNY